VFLKKGEITMEMKVKLYYVVQPGSGHVDPVGTIIPCTAFTINMTKVAKLHPTFTVKECIEHFCKLAGVNPNNYVAMCASR
jgi:hypothetical protein